MSSTDDFQNGHSEPNGVAKTTANVNGKSQAPIADIEITNGAEADQNLLDRGQGSVEATKCDIRAADTGKGADKLVEAPEDVAEGDSQSPTENVDAVKRELYDVFMNEILMKARELILEERASKGDGASGQKAKRILKNLDVTEEDEKKTGIRHRILSTDGEGKRVISRNEDPSKPTKKNPDWWLTTLEKEDASKEKFWEIKVADKEVMACIRETIYDYLVHTGGSRDWRKDSITLKSFVTLVLNWSSLKQIGGKAKDETVALSTPSGIATSEQASAGSYSRQTYERIGIVLKYVQDFNPHPIEILEQQPDEIEFDNLWVLFKPGKLVVTTWSQDSIKYPQVFKVSQFGTEDSGTRRARLKIEAWMFDWNGTDIDRTLFYFYIPNFEITLGASVRSVNSLEVYPVEYYINDAGQTGIEAIHAHDVYQNRRKSFIEYAVSGEGKRSPLRLQYSGDVLHTESTGPQSRVAFKKTDIAFEEILTLDTKLDSIRRVKIDEHIVLDAENYIRKGPGRRLLGKRLPIDKVLCNCTLCLDSSIQSWLEETRRGDLTQVRSDYDLLLPPRLFGYALSRKDWFQFAIDRIKPDEKHPEDLKEVIFPRNIGKSEQNNIVQMVRNYSTFMDHPDQRIGDFIGGKGTSLIFLFHGPSGTGKTFCAEALASDSGKSLFKVGISDIGLNAAEAEKNLREIFELAEAWNVVLLIDEADVLLDSRGKEENEGALQKNALVSVLLRELEYFKGILIMTTNRLIVLDPAIISRIHYSIYFETLTPDQENYLWERWVQRLQVKGLVKSGWDARGWLQESSMMNAGGLLQMNGREIRNTWINAQLLSFGENSEVKVGKDDLQSCFLARQRFLRESQMLAMKAEAHSGKSK